MIGHSNVGKTTYMTSMYGCMQRSINGFTLSSKHSDDHERLLALCRSTHDGQFPALTDQRAQYEFRLCLNGTAFFDFQWIDRRGGAILERSTSNETIELLSDLESCDGLMIFCDGAAATRGDEDANEMERISQLVGRAVGNRYTPMPLAMVMTKSDLIEPGDPRATAPLMPLLDVARRNSKLQHAIIRVACGPNENNVAAPVLFTLKHGISNKENELWNSYNYWKSLAEKEQEKANEWGGLVDWWRDLNGEQTYSDKARISRNIAAGSHSSWYPLYSAAQKLDEYLRDVLE